MKILIILVFMMFVLGSFGAADEKRTTLSRRQLKKFRRAKKKEMKRIRKARERAEMDAFEDWYMYYEVFHEDDWC